MNPVPITPAPPRWLHVLAVLTVLLTLPLLFLGASVTSFDVGMVDARGFRWPWEIVRGLFENNGLGWMLEYGHRTFGFLVGLCGIGLAIGCCFYGRAVATFGILALVMICIQGALGAFRVDFNAMFGRSAAMIHGAFAQIVFATLVAVAVLTSRRWAMDSFASRSIASLAIQRWSLITMLVVFGQLVLGGLVRHQQDSVLGPRGHLLGAFVVVAVVVWFLKVIRENEASQQFKIQRILLMTLLALQLWLGVESWLAKFYDPRINFPQLTPAPTHREWLRSAHYLAGTLIFATTVTIALIAHRKEILALTFKPQDERSDSWGSALPQEAAS